MNTVAAISTPQAAGAIGIVRISGDTARDVADRVFKSVSGKKIKNAKGYTALYGKVYNNDELIDEAVCLVFAAPKSYTGEDVVELSCHGGMIIINKLLQAVLDNGAQIAQPGEFTKRAFLNKKIDLTQADAVMELISAKSQEALRAALSMKEGLVSKRITSLCEKLLDTAGHLAAWADFPEEDIEEVNSDVLLNTLLEVKNEVSKLIESFDKGVCIREGVKTAIVGRPNVGKSTLMNKLTDSERSIVTSQAGTTRDIVEETVRIGKIMLNLSDTAGIRQSSDEVEQIGVQKAKERIASSSLILAVFDAGEELSQEDKELLEMLPEERTVALINKSDRQKKLDDTEIKNKISNVINISAKIGEMEELTECIEKMLGANDLDRSEPMLCTQRQRLCAVNCLNAVEEAVFALKAGITLDAVSVSIESAVDALLELTGQKATTEVVDKVFHNFCVGK